LNRIGQDWTEAEEPPSRGATKIFYFADNSAFLAWQLAVGISAHQRRSREIQVRGDLVEPRVVVREGDVVGEVQVGLEGGLGNEAQAVVDEALVAAVGVLVEA
jgi:hypothetical protein